MGVVYRAYQPSLAREVALKVLPRWFAAQPGFTERFKDEARAAARLHHPNIVIIHDVRESDGWHYIVMQLLRGQTLEAIMRQQPLPIARSLSIASQIASALDYAHAQGIVHRDVKPANIIVDADDRATLTDFGIARIAEQTVQRTITGTMLGTPEYMAPEQAEGRAITRAADEYALACVLYEMLAGHPPFESETPMGVLLQHAHTPPPRLSLTRTGLPSALDGVFQRGLAKEPARRFQTCGELVRAVTEALQGRAGAATSPGRSAAVAAAIAVGALLLTSAVVLATRGTSVPPIAASTAQPTSQPAIGQPTPTATPRAIPTAIAATPTSGATALPAAATSSPPTPLPTRALPPTVAPPVAPTTPPATPTGSLVLVRANQQNGKDLFRVRLSDGRPELQLTNGPAATWNWAPAISCDGQWLAFATGTSGSSDIAVMRPDGSQRQVIAHSPSLTFGSPWWMQDGRVSFNGSHAGSSEIYAAPLSGGAAVPITSTSDIEGTGLPTWACRPGPLAIIGKIAGVAHIYVRGSNGDFTPISPSNAEGYAPAWSPDGQRLAFQSGGGALNGIVTMAADGSDVRQIVTPKPGFWARAPAWSPDGRWLAYVSSDSSDDTGDVFVVPSNGGQPRQLTSDGSTYDWRIAWLP
jgi:serine/threonine-protein kinase